MKTYNTFFHDFRALDEFICKHEIELFDKEILIQIFSATLDKKFLKFLIFFLHEKIPKAKIIGASTDGEICEGQICTDSTVISFSLFEHTTLCTQAVHLSQEVDSFKAGELLAQALVTKETKALIIFADGLRFNGDDFLKGIKSIGTNVVVAGGMAGDNYRFEQTMCFCDKEVDSGMAVGVALNSERLKAYVDYSFAWEGIGKEFCVTKACKNRIYEIDGISPLALYEYYLGKDIAAALPQVGVNFPFIIWQNKQEVARAIMAKHDDGSVSVGGNIQEGESIRFGIGNIENILNDSLGIYESLKDAKVEGLFTFSCIARRKFLGKSAEEDTEHFKYLSAMGGFFTYGEFFTSAEDYLFLNESLTVLALSEECEQNRRIFREVSSFKTSYNPTTMKALSHIVKKTTSEIKELNATLQAKVEEQTKKLLEQNKELSHRVYHDRLTTLPNREALLRDLASCEIASLIKLNIDRFQSINDLYGYKAGNLTLVAFGKYLKQKAGNAHIVYRLSGDEFAVLQLKTANQMSSLQLLRSLVDELEEKVWNFSVDEADISISITATAGLARHGEHLLRKANMALHYAHKKKIPYAIYSPSLKMVERYENDINMNKVIKEAIKEDRVVPFFQPIFQDGKINKYECLVRIRLRDGSILSPIHFLEIAKRSRQYDKLTRIMIEKSFKEFKDRTENFSLNLSFEDIEKPKTLRFIKERFRQYPDISKRLVFEIVESESIDNFQVVERFIKEVRAFGVKIAIDDFGSGFSNFSYLLKLKPDFLKIDGSLIKEIDQNEDTYIITKTITDFTKLMKIETIAEYIHSKSVYTRVQELGVDMYQGYYFGEPKPELLETTVPLATT